VGTDKGGSGVDKRRVVLAGVGGALVVMLIAALAYPKRWTVDRALRHDEIGIAGGIAEAEEMDDVQIRWGLFSHRVTLVPKSRTGAELSFKVNRVTGVPYDIDHAHLIAEPDPRQRPAPRPTGAAPCSCPPGDPQCSCL
jgi:hypothetical protein